MHFLHIAFLRHLVFFQGIANMAGNHRLLSPKQLGHLDLRQPNLLCLQTHRYLGLAVFGLVNFNLIISTHIASLRSLNRQTAIMHEAALQDFGELIFRLGERSLPDKCLGGTTSRRRLNTGNLLRTARTFCPRLQKEGKLIRKTFA